MTEETPVEIRVSASQIDTFEKCGYKWKLRYIDKIYGDPTPAQQMGTFVHEVLENLYELPSDKRSEEAAKRFAREIWDQFSETEDFKFFNLSEEEKLEFRRNSWKLIRRLWDIENPEKIEVDSVEMELKFPLFDDVSFIGFADRVDATDSGHSVVDYKSGKRPANRFSGEKKRQIRLYAIGVEEVTGKEVTRGKLLFLGGDQPGIISEKITDEIKSETWDELKRFANEIAVAYDTGGEMLKPTTHVLCGWCEYIHLCSSGENFLRYQVKNGEWKRYDAPAIKYLGLSK